MDKNRLLPVEQVKRQLKENLGKFGNKEGTRIWQLMQLMEEAKSSLLNYSDIMDALFSDDSPEKAENNFKKFRSRFNKRTKEIGIDLQMGVDSRKNMKSQYRQFYVTGTDLLEEELELHSEAETSPASEKMYVEADATIERPTLKYFVSYDGKEVKLKNSLIDFLEANLKASPNYDYEKWDDSDILTGENWHERIQEAIQECHFGLLLLSLNFINNEYIEKNELFHFLPKNQNDTNPKKYPIIVGLKKVDLKGRHDLKGIEEIQIFRYRPNERKYFFSECNATEMKEDFARNLFFEIEKIFKKKSTVKTPETKRLADVDPPTAINENLIDEDAILREKLSASIETKLSPDIKKYIAAMGRQTLVSNTPVSTESEEESTTVKVQQHFLEWLKIEDAPPYCALLGELGMGKTINCQILTQRLLDLRKEDNSYPFPIYMDLRELKTDNNVVPELKEIIERTLNAGWKKGEKSEFEASDILRLVRENGALLIFDGLEEKIIHLSEADAQRFIRQLWEALPPNLLQPEKKNKDKSIKLGKLIISCRTHYFRDAIQQNSMLRGEDRDGVEKDHYTALFLLPFSETQIFDYLRKNFKGREPAEIYDLIKSVHNLKELSTRPLTLNYIVELIPEIEKMHLEGKKVHGVTLYQLMTERWLYRDEGKHKFNVRYKQSLMENLAAEMWRGGEREWSVDKLEEWLADFLEQNKRIRNELKNISTEILQEDLRTATFVVRPGKDKFRFAHTSLQEYFLACYLHRALVEKKSSHWDIPMPSIETFDFLAQIIETQETQICLSHMEEILTSYKKNISELVFKFWLHCHEAGYITPEPNEIDLRGAQLESVQVVGKSADKLFNLRGAELIGANLEKALFKNVDVSYAAFNSANLWLAEFNNVNAYESHFNEADITGTVFREFNGRDSDFTNSAIYETQWLCSDLDGAKISESSINEAHFAESLNKIDRKIVLDSGMPQTLEGHANWVLSCAISPDGKWALSGSEDNTLKVWDLKMGKCRQTLEGHANAVRSCAISPDGKWALSGSSDNTLKVWDLKTGKCLQEFANLPNLNYVSFDRKNNKIMHASKEAWRWLGYTKWDEKLGRLRRYPAEINGPIPGCE